MVSSELAWETIDKEHSKVIRLAPIASMTEDIWSAFLKEQFASHPKKILMSIISDKLSRRFAE
jgi:hypothetical protein